MVLLTLFAFVALVAGTYRLGRTAFTPFVGAIAAFLVLTRFDFPSLAVRAYLDIPFMAAIVWAGALEAARPRRGTPVFLLLAAAGLMRPEAWILSGVYFLWMSWHADWGERFRYAALTAIGPLGWVATDFIVTGDPLFSLTSTQDLAAELERTKSGGDVIVGAAAATCAAPSRRRSSSPGLIGLAIAVWKFPLRAIVPLMLFLAGAFTFVATGLAGLSVIVRYLLVPVGDAEPVRGGRARRVDDGAARRAAAARLGDRRRAWSTVLGLAYTALPPAEPRALQQRARRSAGEQGQSLHRAARDRRRSSAACAAAPVSVPTHKLIPDTRWVLGPRRGRRRRALGPGGRVRAQGALRRRDLPGRAHEHPAHRLRGEHRRDRAGARRRGFQRIATDRYFAAYVRCPPGVPSSRGSPAAPAGRLGAGARRRAGRRARAAPVGRQARAAVRLQRGRGLELRPDRGQLLLHRQLQPALLHQPAGVLVPAARRARDVVRRRLAVRRGPGRRRFATDPTAVFVVARVTVGGARAPPRSGSST